MYNRLILVAGSPRSGTSLFAGMLGALGCHIPQPEVARDDRAPKGFGESQWVVNYHSKLLRRAGVETWDARPAAWSQTADVAREQSAERQLQRWIAAEFDTRDHVVIKDARLHWFLPAWRRAGETVATPCFITLLRHPLEIVEDKKTPYGERWHPNAQTASWINSMLYGERSTRGDRRGLVRYEELEDDAMLAVAQVSERLDLSFIERPMPAQMREATNLADPSLKPRRLKWPDLEVNERLVELAEEVFATLDRAGRDDELDEKPVASALDDLRKRYVDLYTFSETTAQFSIAAKQRGAPSGSPAIARDGSLLTRDMARKVMERTKRKSKRTIYQLRKRSGIAAGGRSQEGG